MSVRCRYPDTSNGTEIPSPNDIRAALRHRLQQEGEKPLFHSGDLTVDLVRRIVKVRGEQIKLPPREYDILRLLIQHAGKVLTAR